MPHPSDVISINGSHVLLHEYPIYQAGVLHDPTTIHLSFLLTQKDPTKVLVRLNNYGDNTFKSNDILYAKLCWPATSPVNFSLKGKFYELKDIDNTSSIDSFDMYLQVEFSPDFYPVEGDSFPNDVELTFNLDITKLRNKWIPIPPELSSLVVYLVGVFIFVYGTISPLVIEPIFEKSRDFCK